MDSSLNKYIPRACYTPSFEEVFTQLDLEQGVFSKKAINLINKRALVWLYNAATYAYATLNLIINLYSQEKHRKDLQLYLDELSFVQQDIRDYLLKRPNFEEDIGSKVKKTSEALSHASNVFNNTFMLLPESLGLTKAVLEARDICHEAIQQPKLTPL